MKIRILVSFIFVLTSLSAYAQDTDSLVVEKSDVMLTTKHYGDKIVLRWAPTDEEWWLYGMLKGYSIARKDMSDVRNRYEVLVDTIMPWTKTQIEEFFIANPENEEIVVPMKTMYLDWENTNYKEANIADVFERSTYFKQRHHMTILAADLYPSVADAAGLRYEDRDIEDGKLYAYRVRFNMLEAKSGAYSVAKNWRVLDRPVILEAKEKENRVVVAWDRKSHESMYTSYFVERSKDSVNYVRLNEHPYTQGIGEGLSAGKWISYIDRVDNYDEHYYRLIGIDAFGDLSAPSVPVLAQGRDRTPPEVTKPKGFKNEEGDEHLIKWEHAHIEELSQVIIWKTDDRNTEGKIIYQSDGSDGYQYEVVDRDVVEGGNIYQLILVDTAGNYAQSMPVDLYQKDKTPPSPPINLSADVDTSGQVILKWDQGPDRDVIAYYVFTAPKKNDNYIKLNQKKHYFRIYADTINMELLTDKRYYKVCAMDKGGNIGEFSEVLEVNLPDRIPPAPCLFYDYRVDTAGVYLGLMPSSSKDVVEHRLYRRLADSGDWQTIKVFGKEVPDVYLDEDLVSNDRYVYKWVAADEGGLESDATHSTINITAYDRRTTYRPLLEAEVTDQGVKIAIIDQIPGEDYRVQIIRSREGQKYKTLTTITDGHVYLDPSISEETKVDVKYRAKILYRDGKRSKFSNDAAID